MMRNTEVIVGIDAGTTSVKSAIFDTTGNILSVSRSTLHVHYGKNNQVEIDMDEVWNAVVRTFRDAIEAVPDGKVIAVGVTGQGDGAWLIDKNGRPLRRAALWLDGRASHRLKQWEHDGRAVLAKQANGSDLFPGALPLLLEEITSSKPGVESQIGGHLNCKDWIKYRMTGIQATDPSEASRTYLGVGRGSYSEHFLSGVGQTKYRSILPEVLPPTTIQGWTTPNAMRSLGLDQPAPVVVSMVDTAAAGVGLGAINDGEGYAIIGTTAFVGVNQPTINDVKTGIAIVLETGRGEQILECLSTMTGTPNLDWARTALGIQNVEWEDIEKLARDTSLGSGGVFYLPYGSPNGERAPFVDPSATASWLGLTIRTTSAQLLRAVYEGISFSISECLDVLGHTGALAIAGGGSESDLFCEILADASGRTIVRQNEPEAGARGAATLALCAVHGNISLQDTVKRLAPEVSSFEPNAARQAEYRRVRSVFITIRDALRPHWPALRAVRDLEPLPHTCPEETS